MVKNFLLIFKLEYLHHLHRSYLLSVTREWQNCFLPKSFSCKAFSFLLRLKLCNYYCVISRLPHVSLDQFYRINNICRAIQIMRCTFLNILQISVNRNFILPTGCPEKSVRNYHYIMRNSTEECRSPLMMNIFWNLLLRQDEFTNLNF